MSFEALKKEILGEARTRSGLVRTELKEQRKQEEARITARARAIEESILEQAESEGSRQAEHLRQETGLRARSAVLLAKQEELDALKGSLREALLGQSEAEVKHLLSALLKLLPKEAGEITAGALHAEMLKKLVKKPYSLSEATIKGEGGFVFASQDAEMDLTMTHLLNQLFITKRAEIARFLFGS